MSSVRKPKSPTEEQQAVLDSTARITVVRACPGAGKTEVFVEAIRKRLREWDHPGSELAALSFTNIAREAIEERVGNITASPYFVGTLDSFVFRFLVKPFAHLVGLPQGAVRLFPAAMTDVLDEPIISVGNENSQRAPMFSIHFCGLDGKQPRITAKLPKIGNFNVPTDAVARVMSEKERFWKNTGIVTHSDCHFLASRILRHPQHGAEIRNILSRRFPVIFIDELQDTGFFLARVFLALFGEEQVSGLVVGDPNQAIYGFGGGNPKIFDDFESLPGAKALRLTLSHRCPKAVAKVATALSAEGHSVEHISNSIDGLASLVVHSLQPAKFSVEHASFLRSLFHGETFAVIARKGVTVDALRGEFVRDEFCGKSRSCRRLNRAVQFFLAGSPREAFRIVEMELKRVMFGSERVSGEVLRDAKIDPASWRSAIFIILTTAAEDITGESWNDWVGRLRRTVKTAAESLGWSDDGTAFKSYMICNETGHLVRLKMLDVIVTSHWGPTDIVATVHKVKGAEFDTVVLFVPKASAKKCPSVEWWSDKDGGEERRIAFVAVSRAKQHFILCLHKTVFEGLSKTRPEFIAGFEPPVAMPNAA